MVPLPGCHNDMTWVRDVLNLRRDLARWNTHPQWKPNIYHVDSSALERPGGDSILTAKRAGSWVTFLLQPLLLNDAMGAWALTRRGMAPM